VTGTGATNTPQTIAVQLTVTPAPQPTISLSRTSLSFTATSGGANPANQAVSISNSGGGTLNWTASVVPGASWLGVVPGSGTDAGTLTVSANITGLAPNTYNGSIQVTGTGATNTPQTIPVQLIVTPAPTPPPPTISDLISLVSGLPDGGVRLFLLARLHNIQALIDRGSTRAACSNLDAFVKDVQLLGKIGRIDPATAEELIHAARAIQASLGCR